MKAVIEISRGELKVAGAAVCRITQVMPDFNGDVLMSKHHHRAQSSFSGMVTEYPHPPQLMFCLEDEDKLARQRLLQRMKDFMISGGFRLTHHGILSAKTDRSRSRVLGGIPFTDRIGGMGVLPKMTYRERAAELHKKLVSSLKDNFIYTGYGILRK